MYSWMRERVLRLMRVPPDPAPPAGAPGSVRVFRAGRNFFKLRLARWGLAQVGALAGIAFSLTFLANVERTVTEQRDKARRTAVAKAAAAAVAPAAVPANTAPDSSPVVKPETPGAAVTKAKAKTRTRTSWKERTRTNLERIAQRWPSWIFPLLALLEFGGIVLYVVQIPFTLAMARLDYELRWYIVTDRSLRIRSGLAAVQESTMSFANLQQVVVTQGPLQRLLGIADLRVQSAGGGGDEQHHEHGESLHTGVFHGVDNANDIRDLILERLRLFRATGLGDPDEKSDAVAAPAPAPAGADALDAARTLLEETRALRRALG